MATEKRYPKIGIIVPPELREQFKTYCDKRHTNMSDEGRRIISRILQAEQRRVAQGAMLQTS